MRRILPAVFLHLVGCASSQVPSSTVIEEPFDAPEIFSVAERFREFRVSNIQPDVDRVSVTIAADPEAVFEALIQVYGELGIEITERNPQARAISNRGFLITRRLGGERLSRYLECGSGTIGGFADRFRIQMSILSQAEGTPEGESRLHTTIQAVGDNPEGTSNTRVPCASTHQLELRIAAQVEELVGGGEAF